jgi:uncharacterized protein (AIM24 family)
MTYLQPTLVVRTRKREKGFWGSLRMTIIGGQSFFVNDFTAESRAGEAASALRHEVISTPLKSLLPGAISSRNLHTWLQKMRLTSTSCGRGLQRGSFGQGLLMIEVTGNGLLFINTFGAIDRHTLAAGESLIVDNHDLVAFSDICQYTGPNSGG